MIDSRYKYKVGQEVEGEEVVTANVSGTYTLDFEKEVYRLTMTADTTFSFSNLPTAGTAKLLTVYLSGDFIPTFPVEAEVATSGSDPYEGTSRNRILFDCIDPTDITYEINNL